MNVAPRFGLHNENLAKIESLISMANVQDMYTNVLGRFNFPEQLHDWQVLLLSSLLEGRNVLGLFPTGSGKSITFILPSIFHDMVSLMNICHKTLSYASKQNMTGS